MKHYAIDQWADFTRGLSPGSFGGRCSRIWRKDVSRCREISQFTGKLTEICASLSQHTAPESIVRLARAIFPVRVPDRPKRGNRVPIELIFDSFLMPSPAGLRSTWQVGWQGLYRAGDCSVDVRIEPELNSQRAAVIGQITNHLRTRFPDGRSAGMSARRQAGGGGDVE